MTPRATALSAVRMAKTFSCTSQRSRRAVSRACRRARRCSSTSPKVRRAGKRKTCRRCKPTNLGKGDVFGDRLFVFLGASMGALYTVAEQLFDQAANGFLLNREEARAAYAIAL